MSNGVMLKHLFKVAGKKGHALGSEEACLYFDGKNAIAASPEATVSIDCPQEIAGPMLVGVKDLKVALLAAPDLAFTQFSDGRIAINGVRVPHVPAEDVVPAVTVEILDLDRKHWYPVVRPFRLDGGRLAQLTGAMADCDPRQHLNGIYLDFASGAAVSTDGGRMHLIEDALPTADLPPERMQGVILPSSMADLLSSVGGVQDVFVMERQVEEEGKTAFRRAICVGAAGAKFRIREVAAAEYPNYRKVFDDNRDHPISIVLDARGRDDLLAVASIAAANGNWPVVTLTGGGKKVQVSHLDRVTRELAMSHQIGAPFSVNLKAFPLSCAVRSAGHYGAAVRLRVPRAEGQTVYIGAQDFHAIVMPVKDKQEDETASESGADAANGVPAEA